MDSESAALISSEKTPLIPSAEGGAIPKTHGSIENPQQVVTTTHVAPTPPVMFGPREQLVTCPHCRSEARTTVKYRANVNSHWVALLLLVLCWPCMCLPYCCNSCKSAHHYCSNCKQYLGKYNNI